MIITIFDNVRMILLSSGQVICSLLCYIFRFEFVAIPLVHPRYKRESFRIMPERPGPLTRSDQVLAGSDWCNLIVAKLSPWIDLDSEDEVLRRNSEKVTDSVFYLV